MEERRKSRRFNILRPATLKIPAEAEKGTAAELEVLADNVAIDGALVVTPRAVRLGTAVELTVFMPNGIRTSCAGTVVRVTPQFTADGAVGLAIACTRPFSEPFRIAEDVM